MSENLVNLELEGSRVEDLFRSTQSTNHGYVPLAVASAIAFHQAQGSTKALVSREDYDDALNIAAAALSRLIPIYTLADPRTGRVEVAVDLSRQSFVRGGAQLKSSHGDSIRELSVRRGDLHSAISLVKRAGLPFALAFPASGPETSSGH